MSKSRSVSRSVSSRTISVDASYAQELVEFWTQKYERVKEELDEVKARVPRLKTVAVFP
jgi:predicted nucleotidyltransferase